MLNQAMCRAPIGRGQQNLRVEVVAGQSERGSAEWPLFDCVINLLLSSDWPKGTHPRESVPFSQSERGTAEGPRVIFLVSSILIFPHRLKFSAVEVAITTAIHQCHHPSPLITPFTP